MAYKMSIRGTQNEVKIRNPWAVALLPLVTLGIYHFVWWYRVNRELRDFGAARGYDLGQSPLSSLLALIPGAFVVVPPLVSYWRGTKRVQGASRLAGKEPLNGWIALILYLLLQPGFWAYIQVSLNEIWRQEAEPLPGHTPPPEPAEEMPPPASGGQPPPGTPGQPPPAP